MEELKRSGGVKTSLNVEISQNFELFGIYGLSIFELNGSEKVSLTTKTKVLLIVTLVEQWSL